jgi:hypothetical protein
LKIVAGGTTRVRVTGPRGPFMNQLQLELSEPPEGIALGKVAVSPEGLEFDLRCNAGKVKPGQQGNLIVNAFIARAQQGVNARPRQNNQRNAPGTLPAIPFEIVAKPEE